MASIYERGCDQKNRHASYWIEYTDHLGRRRVKKGFIDIGLAGIVIDWQKTTLAIAD